MDERVKCKNYIDYIDFIDYFLIVFIIIINVWLYYLLFFSQNAVIILNIHKQFTLPWNAWKKPEKLSPFCQVSSPNNHLMLMTTEVNIVTKSDWPRSSQIH